MKNNLLIYAVAALFLVGGLFFLLKRQEQVHTPRDARNLPEEITSPSPTLKSNVAIVTLVIKDKKLTSGPETIKVNQHDKVIMKITSDEAEEFHIHGYNKFVTLKPNEQAELSLIANLTGRFVFELEKSKTDLGALEVQPK